MAITLQALAEHHIPAVLDACSDWQELARYGPPYWRPRSSAELHRKIADTAGPQLATAYTFVLATENRLVGEASIHTIDWRNLHAQVGICIWRSEDRRHGYGRAGADWAIAWATGHLGLRRLEAWILEDNAASLELFSKLGFVREGTLRKRYLCNGRYVDVHVMAYIISK